jgi:hypothetical protein
MCTRVQYSLDHQSARLLEKSTCTIWVEKKPESKNAMYTHRNSLLLPPPPPFIQGVEFDSCIDLIELILMVLLP